MKSPPPKLLILPNIYWLGVSFMWNSINILILPAMLLEMVPEGQKNTALGLLTFIGLLVAMIVQPAAGAWSDRRKSAWGRRRPFMVAGVAGDYLFLTILALAGGVPWLTVGYVGLQLSSNLAHGPAQGLLPDLVPRPHLGMASGIRNLMDMLGLVAASLVTSRLLGSGGGRSTGAFLLIGLMLSLAAAVTILGVRERSVSEGRLKSDRDPRSDVPASLLGLSQGYRRLLAARFLFLLGLYGIQGFGQYYIRDVLSVPDPVRLTGNLAAALTLAAIAFALLGGWLGDRLGDRKTQVLAASLGVPGCLLLLTAETTVSLLLYAGLVGAAFGMFLTANWAQANRLAPSGGSGRVLGLTNLATAGAAACSRLIGPLIDLVNNASPGGQEGYNLLFLLAAAGMVWSAGIIFRGPGDSSPNGRDGETSVSPENL